MAERITDVNWQRIEWCCAERRITVDELSAATGVPASAFDRLANGEDALTYNQLHAIANYFGRGVLFFLEQGQVDPAKVFTSGFRTLANQKHEIDGSVKKIIERAEWQRQAYLSLREEIDDDNVTDFLPPDLQGLSVEQAADTVRSWLALDGLHSFDEYRRAVERKGILVFRTNGYQGKWQVPKASPILGFAIYHSQFPLIVVRKTKYESRQTFTLFHELAHILLHKQSVIDDEHDYHQQTGKEREANRFAGFVLIPKKNLAAIHVAGMPDEPSEIDDWLRQHRAAWGVSTEVILLRLVDARRISQSVYSAYREWQNRQRIEEESGGSREYRYREPRHLFGDGYVRTVLSALEQRRITLTKASKFLDGLKLNDLHKLESYCASH